MNAQAILRSAGKTVLIGAGVLTAVMVLAALPGRHPAPFTAQQVFTAAAETPAQQAPQPMHHDHAAGMDTDDAGKSEEHAVHDMTPGHHHEPGPHMRMTGMRPQAPEDRQRAHEVVASLRAGIEKYRDYRVALGDGYKIFLPNLPLPEYHFTNYRNGFLEAFTFEPSRPTSLLYKKTPDGYELVGAMYTMPRRATEEQLNARVPLSVARWHLHTNLCLPPKDEGLHADWKQFGLQGFISTEDFCTDAGGRFFPVVFGWMVHVYPYEDSLDKVFRH